MKYFKRLKDDSVDVARLSEEMVFAWGVVCAVYSDYNNLPNCVVTSANDGTHMSGSRHYTGDALDFRVWAYPENLLSVIVSDIQDILGDEYVVVNEFDHIHVEYERK